MKHAIFVVTDNSGNRKYLNAEESRLTASTEEATIFEIQNAVVREAMILKIARDYAPVDQPVTIEAWEVDKVSVAYVGGIHIRGVGKSITLRDLKTMEVRPPRDKNDKGPYTGYIPRATVLEFD